MRTTPQQAAVPVPSKIPLTLAISPYDHVDDLANGRVAPEGIDLTVLTDMRVEEIFYRFIVNREWDVSEMAMGKYVAMRSQGDDSLTAIPIFPSRIFRHASMFVRKEGPVKTPSDLRGRTVGIPEWAQTAAIYSRAVLAHEYGVDLRSLKWVQAGVDQPGRIEKVRINLPAGFELVRRPDATLNDMLLSGEVDCVVSAQAPACFDQAHPNIRRLIENFVQVEADYYKRTGILPIMHVVAMRKDVFERTPWSAGNLLKAFQESKRRSIERLSHATHQLYPMQWCFDYMRHLRDIFGEDHWPYGIEANRKTLEAFLLYAYEQGVCARQLAIDEIFPKQVQSSFRV
jgi:4,5-dihydroxyphthalate decarboxylase